MSDTGLVSELFALNIVFPTGEELYDSIMSEIEPELMLSNVATLDAPYATESVSDKKKRYERYGKAFAKYKNTYDLYMKSLSEALGVYKRTITEVASQVNDTKESSVLTALEEQLSAF